MKTNRYLLMISLLFSLTLCAQVNIKEIKKDVYQLDKQVIDLNVLDKIKASPIEIKKYKNQFKQVIDNLKETSDLLKQYKKVKLSADNPKYLKKLREELLGKMKELDQSDKPLMVSMQGAMQQRSQTVTMATQMLKSINDSSNSIALNIGR